MFGQKKTPASVRPAPRAFSSTSWRLCHLPAGCSAVFPRDIQLGMGYLKCRQSRRRSSSWSSSLNLSTCALTNAQTPETLYRFILSPLFVECATSSLSPNRKRSPPASLDCAGHHRAFGATAHASPFATTRRIILRWRRGKPEFF